MDKSSLDGLIDAYAAAPSPSLARVIVLELLQGDRAQDALAYLDAAVTAFQPEDADAVGSALLSAGSYAAITEHFDADVPTQAVVLARALLELGEDSRAREVYQAAIEAAPGVQDETMNERLGVAADSPASVTRLRLVEKVDPMEVVNIDRYRASATTFDDVVGLEKVKRQVNKRIIMPFQKPSLFSRFRKKIGGGVLLYGPPGCGKTLLARATAGECNASFFNVEIADVLDMYIGESERKLHAIFEKARAEAPSVLFFDEIEALAGKREHTHNATASKVVSLMLTELDGYAQNNAGVLVLASTNVPWALDPAFLRPGRFDRMFFVPPPDREARGAILQHHMRERPATGDIDYLLLAKKTNGYSGADLANLVEMAADEAIDASIEAGEDQPISFEHFKDALGESRSSTVEWLTTARNYARYANDGGRYNDVVEFLEKHGQ
ncbi:MAG: ATP-binding protein [Pseudomonadota bacterium]